MVLLGKKLRYLYVLAGTFLYFFFSILSAEATFCDFIYSRFAVTKLAFTPIPFAPVDSWYTAIFDSLARAEKLDRRTNAAKDFQELRSSLRYSQETKTMPGISEYVNLVLKNPELAAQYELRANIEQIIQEVEVQLRRMNGDELFSVAKVLRISSVVKKVLKDAPLLSSEKALEGALKKAGANPEEIEAFLELEHAMLKGELFTVEVNPYDARVAYLHKEKLHFVVPKKFLCFGPDCKIVGIFSRSKER